MRMKGRKLHLIIWVLRDIDAKGVSERESYVYVLGKSGELLRRSVNTDHVLRVYATSEEVNEIRELMKHMI